MESDLAIHGVGAWLRLLFGLVVFLAPGLALADRIFTDKTYLLLAPVFSFSALPLAAILLDFAFGVPINTITTGFIALTLTAWMGWPRGMQLLRLLGQRQGWADAR